MEKDPKKGNLNCQSHILIPMSQLIGGLELND